MHSRGCDDAFETFGTSHLAMLGGLHPRHLAGRRPRPPSPRHIAGVRVSRIYAGLIPCFTIPLQVIDFLPGNYDLQTTLPCSCATSRG